MIFVITSCTERDKSSEAEEEKPILLAMSSSKNSYDDFSMLFTLNKDKTFEWKIIRNSKNSIYENRIEKGTYELDGDTIRLKNNKRFKIAILKDGHIEFIDQCMRLQLLENQTGIKPIVSQQNRADFVFFTAHPLNFMTRENGASIDLKPNEIDLIEHFLDEEIKQHKSKRHPNQKAYFKQCIAYRNADNQRIVKIYGASKFGDDHDGFWDNELIMVEDGGEYYFEAEINLTKKELTRFLFNGTA